MHLAGEGVWGGIFCIAVSISSKMNWNKKSSNNNYWIIGCGNWRMDGFLNLENDSKQQEISTLASTVWMQRELADK